MKANDFPDVQISITISARHPQIVAVEKSDPYRTEDEISHLVLAIDPKTRSCEVCESDLPLNKGLIVVHVIPEPGMADFFYPDLENLRSYLESKKGQGLLGDLVEKSFVSKEELAITTEGRALLDGILSLASAGWDFQDVEEFAPQALAAINGETTDAELSSMASKLDQEALDNKIIIRRGSYRQLCDHQMACNEDEQPEDPRI